MVVGEVPVAVGHGRALPALGQAMILAGFAGAAATLALVVHARAWPELVPVLLPVPWLVTGALAVRARPGHPGALMLLGLGAGHLTAFALSEPVSLDRSLDGWTPWTLATIGAVLYLLGFASLGCFLATYPTGVPQTRLVRWFVPTALVAAGLAGIATQVLSDPVVLVSQGGRPAMPAPPGLPLVASSLPVEVVGPLAVVAGLGLLVARGRRAAGEERRQLSWAVGAGGLLALLLVSTPAVDRISPTLQTVSFFAVVSVIPFVLLAGLVRFRLMDVDLYVARTLARGVVVVLVLGLYAVVAGVAGRSEGVVAAGLVVLAALTGTPLVGFLERLVDRWISGGRVRGQQLLHRLSDELTAPTRVEQARRTATAVWVGLDASWVRLVAEGVDVVAGSRPPEAPAEAVVPLVATDTEVGRLECGPRHGGWGAGELAEVALLARHAGLALHNSELATRLERQVVELEASRRRIVRADLRARKQLQRDLHDGVQQRVVAMIAHLGTLRVLLPGGSRESQVVDGTLEQARATLVELRHVVDGVAPPVLLDQGLLAALRSRAPLLPLPVRVLHDGGRDRWETDTEAAAYYVVSEALTNVVKHAGATRAEVRVAQDGRSLRVAVSDDGGGVTPGSSGSGIAGMHDRVEALGGSLVVESSAAGTTVTARLPTGCHD